MKSSSLLTRLLIVDWFKCNLPTIAILAGVFVILSGLYFNPVISGSVETALVIRNQQLPSKYTAVPMIAFVELSNGRTVTVYIPMGKVPPSPGNNIRVRHNTHLFYGDSFDWLP